jgi:hypothetical protein
MAKGKLRAHRIAQDTKKGYKSARSGCPKYSQGRKEGFSCPKTNPPGHGGANIRGITGK